MKGEINDLIKTSDRHDLLGENTSSSDNPYPGDYDERGRLLQGLDRVDDGNRRLENSHRIALDTEDVGADILRNLRMQREQIENTHNTLGQADTGGCEEQARPATDVPLYRHRQIDENTQTDVETFDQAESDNVADHWSVGAPYPDCTVGQIYVKHA